MVGKSTLGRSLTGSERYPATPNSTIPIITSAVMTGRLMKISVMFIALFGRATGPSLPFLIHLAVYIIEEVPPYRPPSFELYTISMEIDPNHVVRDVAEVSDLYDPA